MIGTEERDKSLILTRRGVKKGMRKIATVTLFVPALLAFTAITSPAGETGHYVSGVEGLKASTIPPPGLYYRMYHVLYDAGALTGGDGEKLDLGFDIRVYAVVNRLIWVTNKKVLGADYFMDIVVPFIDTDLEISALSLEDSEFGPGDINIEPFGLSWHGRRYDAGFGLSFYLPTGEYGADEPASPGKDFRTTMITLGATGYFDAEKRWSASILGRYELHGEKKDTDVRPGDDFHFEWGVGRSVAKIWDVGLTGYCHWQVTDDGGSDVAWDADRHDRVYAVGPEVGVFIPPAKLFLSLRGQWEFDAVDRPEGHVINLTLTKIF